MIINKFFLPKTKIDKMNHFIFCSLTPTKQDETCYSFYRNNEFRLKIFLIKLDLMLIKND